MSLVLSHTDKARALLDALGDGVGRVPRPLDEALSGSGFREVVFDMSAVSFMDSTGIGLLLGRYKRGRGRGIPMRILNPNPVCDKIFVLSGIYQVMPKAEGVQEGRA